MLNFNTFPEEMQIPKPIREPNLDEMRRLRDAGKLMVQRKRDGSRVILLVTDEGEVKLYSRTHTNYTSKFPAIVKMFEGMQLPAKTMLDGELVLERDGQDQFNLMNSLSLSGDAVSVRKQKHLPVVRFMAFDVLYLGGKATFEMPYQVRHDVISKLEGTHPLIFVAKDEEGSLDACMVRADLSGWEGLVFWHKEFRTKIGFGSTSPRENCWKWKPSKEEDFIATGFEYGTGHMSTWMGALNLVEYKGGKPVSVGGVGTGFTEAERREAVNWTYPCVVEVLYDERTPTGKIRFPRFLRKRDDKHVLEVINDGRLA